MQKRWRLLCALGIIVTALTGCNRKTTLPEAFQAQQLVVVTTEEWSATSGHLAAYEWEADAWKPVIEDIPVIVGRNGMAWGEGLHQADLVTSPTKREGDGKSPAGIYYLESLYGYEPLTTKMDYLQVDDTWFCVDDSASQHYNRIVTTREVQPDWNSAETMRMPSDVYKYGIVVGYNTRPAVAGKGSCIFMHLGEPGGTTAGCTGMAEADILRVMGFLDKSKNPVIVQAPESEYRLLTRLYDLP